MKEKKLIINSGCWGESKGTGVKSICWILVLLTLFGCAGRGSEGVYSQTSSAAIDVAYLSEDGERLEVVYDNIGQFVVLEWEDRTVILPVGMSASGARYSADGTEVFWSKGETARFWVDGAMVFEGREE